MTKRKPTSAHLKSATERQRVIQKRGPKQGYDRTDHDTRGNREKSFTHPVDFSVLVQNDSIRETQLTALRKVFKLLFDAELLDSKAQFCAMMLYGSMTPVPIQDAAAICCCSRAWFHKLDSHGRIKMIRADDRKLYLRADDITRILQGTV